MKNYFGQIKIVFLLVLLLSSLSGCGLFLNRVKGNGKIVEKTWDLQDPNAVELGIQGVVTVSEGSEESLKIVTDENLFDYIEVSTDGKVKLESKANHNLVPSNDIEVHITVNDDSLSSFKINGSADITAPRSVLNSSVSTEINGSGDIMLKKDSSSAVLTNQNVRINGSGDYKSDSISMTNGDVHIAGSGNLRLGDVSGNLKIKINGSGDVRMEDISGKVDVVINGSGDVSYRSGSISSQETKGSGSIFRR